MLYIIFSLPSKLHLPPNSTSRILDTGLSAKNELLAALYVLHYVNRAVVSPLFLAPSMSPIHASISLIIAMFQFINSSCLACWLVYSELTPSDISFPTLTSLVGLAIFFIGIAGNTASGNEIFTPRRGAAKGQAEGESKTHITTDHGSNLPTHPRRFQYIPFSE